MRRRDLSPPLKDLQYLSMGDSSYKLNFDLGKKNENQHHS
jgi:hypothetical protein